MMRSAALAVLAVAVVGCQTAAAGPAGHDASRPAAGHSAASSASQPSPSNPPSIPLSGPAVRIMIVGDSMTKGSSGDYTWQYRLYKHLVADGIRAQMVGPNRFLFNNVTGKDGSDAYADPNFGRANDATWGKALFEEEKVIGPKVATYRPGYLLELLGLDDLFWFGISQQGMATNLAAFIAHSRAAQPHIRIVLGLIPPDIHTETSKTFAASVAAFNRTILSTAARLSTARSPIAVARDTTGINVTKDYWDGTHPNANGEVRIAAAFSDALAGKLHLGQAYPTPYPLLPTGPLIGPRLTVTPASHSGAAKLSWTLSPGATDYFIYFRDVTQKVKFTRLPLPVKMSPWPAGLLTPGNTYAFKVQACKGIDCNAFSNIATVVAP